MNAVVGTAHSVFVAVARYSELEVGRPHGVVIEDRPICVLRTEDDVIAFDDRCPHRGHPLSAATCEPGLIRCALHGWEFSVPDGQAISPRAPFGLELHETRIVNDVIEVSL